MQEVAEVIIVLHNHHRLLYFFLSLYLCGSIYGIHCW